MNVNELMSREPRAVRIGERLDAAARVLWEVDCGFAPVVDAAGTLIGVLTDRDLCMASYTQGRSLGEIPVTAAMAREVRTCRADDTLASALASLQQAQVHRLPVVDARNVLVGVLSTNDLVRAAVARPAAVDGKSVLQCLAAIGAPRHGKAMPALAAAPAAEPARATRSQAKAVDADAGDDAAGKRAPGKAAPGKDGPSKGASTKAAPTKAKGRSRTRSKKA